MQSSSARALTVLVTGGSGFLGSWCVIDLLRRGYRVRTTIRDLAREPQVRGVIEPQVGGADRFEVLEADLGHDDGWEEAVRDCDYVLHVASPFPPKQPDDPDELIVPAREGTLRVLRASLDAGVERVVLTSSAVAVANSGRPPASGDAFTEDDWSDPSNPTLTPYGRSKTIAERSAWDLVSERGSSSRLAVVNPSAILGPVLSDDRSYSLQAIERLLNGMPGVPQLGFSFVDVRDVADLHHRAMIAPEAAGERFLAAGPFLWMAEVAQILRDRLGESAAKVPTRKVPNFVVKAMARFDPGLRSVVGDLGKRRLLSSEKAKNRLGWSPRPIEDTIAETGETLLHVDAVAGVSPR
jgi:nucleoside-diphosphate-sugar epimerase